MTQPLPRAQLRSVVVPPIKSQGIKTKLVRFILSEVRWSGRGRWIEPFLGSGVVCFNVRPDRAVANDSDIYIVRLYQGIYAGDITPHDVREHLVREGDMLATVGEQHYYAIRERFNKEANPIDFLFLNRACFNGMIRFNGKGEFNVPFCRKPERFRPAYVTKIVNQVAAVRDIIHGKAWVFTDRDWRDCLDDATEDDFVYLDPPYIGRHTDYYNRWSADDALEMVDRLRCLPCGFALSMWHRNKYRENAYVKDHWEWATIRLTRHFYHLGSTENLRNSMEEALIIAPGHEAAEHTTKHPARLTQLELAL